MTSLDHRPTSRFAPIITPKRPTLGSVLTWPAWLRMLAVLPALLLLWLAVGWAGGLSS